MFRTPALIWKLLASVLASLDSERAARDNGEARIQIEIV